MNAFFFSVTAFANSTIFVGVQAEPSDFTSSAMRAVVLVTAA